MPGATLRLHMPRASLALNPGYAGFLETYVGPMKPRDTVKKCGTSPAKPGWEGPGGWRRPRPPPGEDSSRRGTAMRARRGDAPACAKVAT
jgi:hypothetical protein